MLQGSYDVHIHTAPDVSPRKCTDLELARRLKAAGMAGAVIKCHFAETASRAALLNEQFPELRFAGGVVLNRSMGGLNPDAVERCGQLGGRYVWFPTMESRSYQAYQHRNEPEADLSRYLPVLDENGALLPAALEVLDAAAKYGMLVGTGHISAREGMALVPEAKKRGLTLVLTHADNPADQYTIEQQVEAVKQGAIVEHCFFTTYYGRVSIEEIARQVRAVGCENVLMASDFGQVKSPYSDEGIDQYQQLLLGQGFTPDELRQMFCENPVKWFGF